MEASAWLLLVGAWLLTYVVHSTVLLCGTWMATRLIRSDAFKETLWKFALMGGLASATLQLGLGFEPLTGRLSLTDLQVTQDLAITEPGKEMITMAPPSHAAQPVPDYSTLTMETPSHRTWSWLLLGLLPGAFAFGSLSLAWLRLRTLLSKRSELKTGVLTGLLGDLRRRSGIRRRIRLTCSKKAKVPMAIGIFRPEICLPERALTGLSRPEQESMLAHELAHLVRNDPAWLAFFRVLEIVFFFQPLNRMGRNAWLELAEYRCDAWAVERLGGSLSLARCLTEVAGWMVEPKFALQGAAVHGMARDRSSLSRRVKRLLKKPFLRDAQIRRRWVALLAPGLLLFTTGSIPGFSVDIGENAPMNYETPLPAGDSSRLDHLALLEALELLDWEIVLLEQEVEALGKMIEGSQWEPELGELFQEAEQRIRAFRVQRTRIESMIRPAIPFSAPDGIRYVDEMNRD